MRRNRPYKRLKVYKQNIGTLGVFKWLWLLVLSIYFYIDLTVKHFGLSTRLPEKK